MLGTLLVALFQSALGDPQIVAPPAPPAPVEQPVATTPAAAPPAPTVRARDVVRCHYEPVTGSRLGRKICRTKAEEDAIADNSRKMLESLQGARTGPTN